MMRRVAVLFFAVLLIATPLVGVTVAQPSAAGATATAASGTASDALSGTAASTDVSTDTSTAADTLSVTASAGSSAQPPRSLARSTTEHATIVRTMSLSLTPERPGSIDVTVTFDLPENVRSLQTTLPGNVSVFRTNGFTHTEGATYEWTEETQTPSLSFHMEANRTGFGTRRALGAGNASQQAADGQYSFVDTGPWAVVPVPQLGTRWSWVGSGSVSLEKNVTFAGEGSTGGEIAFLGAHQTHVRTAQGQTFRLVVPEAARMTESPTAVLDSVAGASDLLRVGARDDEVFFVAAPTSVSWAAQGIEYGGSDAWIRADARLDVPGNVWIHEYVHTRQAYEPTSDTLWTVEGGAEYYSALLTLRQGRIDFQAFRDFLSRGTRDPYADAVLTRPQSWPYLANYLKGALVFGALDRQTRLTTDSQHTMGDTLRELNARDEPITQSFFLSTIRDVASPNVRDLAERYTTTSAVPDPWSRAEHQQAFATLPPRMDYAVSGFRVGGTYRNQTLGAAPSLVTGETLTARVVVTNVGGTSGTYNTTLTVNGSVADTATGTLDPDESSTVTLAHTFTSPGTYPVSVGSRDVTVTVQRPAAPTVTDLTATPSTVRPGESVTVRATVQNQADRPAAGNLTLVVDGEPVPNSTWTPRLPVDGETSQNYTLTFEEAGTHQVRLGDRTATVTVQPDTAEPGAGDTETPTTTPGLGVVSGLVALAAAALVSARFR